MGRLLQERDDLLPCDGRKAREELVDGVAGFEAVEQSLNGDARSTKDRSATHYVRIARDDLLVHGPNCTRRGPD